jgi:hypothetical protein
MNDISYKDAVKQVFGYTGKEAEGLIKGLLIAAYCENGFTKRQAMTLANELIKKVKND